MSAPAYSRILFSRDGAPVAGGGDIRHLVAASAASRHILPGLPQGMIALSNDPYTGGLDLRDIMLFMRRDDGYVCVVSRYDNVGAMKDSAFRFIRECAHEGLRLKDVLLPADAALPEWFGRFVRANLADGDGMLGQLEGQRAAAFATMDRELEAFPSSGMSKVPAFNADLAIDFGREHIDGRLTVDSGAIRLSLAPRAPDADARNATSSATHAAVLGALSPRLGVNAMELLALTFHIDVAGPHAFAAPYPFSTSRSEEILAPLRQSLG